MRIVSVTPFAHGLPFEELSYFSKDDVNPGDLVEITVRKRNSKALVISAYDASADRQSLRSASFSLKKIVRVIKPQFLHSKMWDTLTYVSSYLMVPVGRLLYDLISDRAYETLTSFDPHLTMQGFEVLLLEQNYENRMLRYKTTVREYFSKKKSIIIFFPTISDLEYAREEIKRGIDEYVVELHSALSEKQFTSELQRIINEPHPIVILSTPSLLPWIRKDLGLVVLEREHSHYYYTHGDQGYDMRFVIERLSECSKTPLLLGSHMLSLYAHKLHTSKDAHEIMPLQFRNDLPISVIPMQGDNKTASPYLSKIALSILHKAKQDSKGHIFLYAHRKGMYPTTVCSDCGTLFTCPTCNRPYVLHRVGGVRTYICHGCEGVVQLNDDTTLSCRHCGGWRMSTLGIATTGVEEELTRLGLPLFVIDSEHTSTKSKVKKVYDKWKESPYGILIGTEMAHNVLQSCDSVIILSLDSLFSLPEYRTDEKILTLVTEMAEKVRVSGSSSNKLILQTRMNNSPVIKQLVSQSFRDVYRTLLKERDEYLLPPYFVVVKATYYNLQEEYKTKIEHDLHSYTVEWFEHGRGVTLLFIHIKVDEWATNETVRYTIKRVTSDASPQVNPLHFFI